MGSWVRPTPNTDHGTPAGQQTLHEQQVLRRRLDAPARAHAQLHPRRRGEQPLVDQRARLAHVAGVEHLDLRLYPDFAHAQRGGASPVRRIEEHAFTEVHGADVEGADLGSQCHRLQPFLDHVLAGDVQTAGSQVDEYVGLLADPVHDLGKQFDTGRRDAGFRLADVDVDNGGTGLAAGDGSGRDFLRWK